jgi:hypothetical protein
MLGRRTPKRAAALDLGPLLTGKVPAHPVAADYLAKLGGGWQMLGNDEAGDCVAVTWSNARRLVTGILGVHGYYPSQAEVWTIYKTQNPDFDPAGSADMNGPGSDADSGMDIQTLLEYLVKTGGPDGVKAVAFAKVNPRSVAEVKAAIAIFGYVWTGINVLACNQQEFSDNQPWDYRADSPVEGGHSILTGGYGKGGGPLGGDERFITWAAETSFTDSFWKNCTDEVWAVLWPEHFGTKAFLEGINQAQLAADYRALTGRSLPVPARAGTPGRTDQEGGTAMSEWQKIEAALRADWAELSGDARRDAEQALADLKGRLAGLEGAAGTLKAELEQAVEAAGPGVTRAVEEALARFLAGIVPEATAGSRM